MTRALGVGDPRPDAVSYPIALGDGTRPVSTAIREANCIQVIAGRYRNSLSNILRAFSSSSDGFSTCDS
jgi:hypothetical protein